MAPSKTPSPISTMHLRQNTALPRSSRTAADTDDASQHLRRIGG